MYEDFGVFAFFLSIQSRVTKAARYSHKNTIEFKKVMCSLLCNKKAISLKSDVITCLSQRAVSHTDITLIFK